MVKLLLLIEAVTFKEELLIEDVTESEVLFILTVPVIVGVPLIEAVTALLDKVTVGVPLIEAVTALLNKVTVGVPLIEAVKEELLRSSTEPVTKTGLFADDEIKRGFAADEVTDILSATVISTLTGCKIATEPVTKTGLFAEEVTFTDPLIA
jgi:hypothetical protein